MEYVVLPGTDLRVSRVCLGTMQFSGSTDEGTSDVTWGSMSQESVNEVVRTALDCGINFFDCAEAYGRDNTAERALGKALEGRRGEAIIASKFGKHRPHWECKGLKEADMYPCYSKADILAAIDRSLAALNSRYIDLYMVHWPVNIGLLAESKKPVEEVVEALEEAKAAGRIRHYGVSNFGTDDLARFLGAGAHVAVNQLPYNLLWRSTESNLLPLCRDRNIGVTCYSPLQQSILGGRYTAPSQVPEGRRRTRLYGPTASEKACHNWPRAVEAEELLWKDGGLLQELRSLSTEANMPMAQAAMAWLFAQPGVVSVIVGASTKAEVERNARVPTVSSEFLDRFTVATEALKRIVGDQIDQYAPISRIHGS